MCFVSLETDKTWNIWKRYAYWIEIIFAKVAAEKRERKILLLYINHCRLGIIKLQKTSAWQKRRTTHIKAENQKNSFAIAFFSEVGWFSFKPVLWETHVSHPAQLWMKMLAILNSQETSAYGAIGGNSATRRYFHKWGSGIVLPSTFRKIRPTECFNRVSN